MKLVIIGNHATPMLNFRKELIQTLVKQGHQVFCLTTNYTEQDKQLLAEWGAIAVDYTLNAQGLNPIKDILATIKLKNTLLKIKPDIVFSFFVKPVIFSTLAAKWAKISRVVGMIEGLGNSFTPIPNQSPFKKNIIKRIQVLLYKLALAKLDHLILLNEDDKKDLLDTYNIKVKKTTILGPIGLDLTHFNYSPSPIQPVSFLFIGRLLAEKGIFDFLEAAKLIKNQYPDTHFTILGGVDEMNPFGLRKEILNQYIKEGLINYPGHVYDINNWITKHSIFVLPSYREGYSRSIQEAMAIGRPVITTDVAGCRQSVINNETGFIVPPHKPQLIAEKMGYFIEHPDEIQRMGIAAREYADNNFDVNKINLQLISIILGNNVDPMFNDLANNKD